MKITKSQRAIYIAISILAAIIFWFYVDNTGSNERDIRLYNVPVTFVGAEDEMAEHGLMIVSGDDTTIDLRLRGRRQVISRINKNNIEIQVDVRSIVSTGSHTLNYSIHYPDSVSSSSVTVVSASLYTVTVEVDELHSKTIEVEADVSGSLPEGYMLHECVLTPFSLTVSGTEEEVEMVDHALVKVTLNNTTTSYSEYLGYDLIDVQGNVITDTKHLRCSEDKVRVELPIVTLKEVPLSVEFIESGGSEESDISYEISPETITISGEEATLEKIIAELDEAMRRQFKEKFAQIAEEFDKVFGELFGGDIARIPPALEALMARCRDLVIVTGDVFADGIAYDETTTRYLGHLAALAQQIACRADAVVEVVFSVPVWLKGEPVCI